MSSINSKLIFTILLLSIVSTIKITKFNHEERSVNGFKYTIPQKLKGNKTDLDAFKQLLQNHPPKFDSKPHTPKNNDLNSNQVETPVPLNQSETKIVSSASVQSISNQNEPVSNVEENNSLKSQSIKSQSQNQNQVPVSTQSAQPSVEQIANGQQTSSNSQKNSSQQKVEGQNSQSNTESNSLSRQSQNLNAEQSVQQKTSSVSNEQPQSISQPSNGQSKSLSSNGQSLTKSQNSSLTGENVQGSPIQVVPVQQSESTAGQSQSIQGKQSSLSNSGNSQSQSGSSNNNIGNQNIKNGTLAVVENGTQNGSQQEQKSEKSSLSQTSVSSGEQGTSQQTSSQQSVSPSSNSVQNLIGQGIQNNQQVNIGEQLSSGQSAVSQFASSLEIGQDLTTAEASKQTQENTQVSSATKQE